jgi:hypothetical protein
MIETIEVPLLARAAEVMNDYIRTVQDDTQMGKWKPSPSEEQTMILVLSGLGGLIEYNVRIAYQRVARSRQLEREAHFSYADLLDALAPHIQPVPYRELLKAASRIRNKLLHADFGDLYKKTRAAYDLPGIRFHQDSFRPLVLEVSTVLTRKGLILNVEDGTARDSEGSPVFAKRHLPGDGGSIPTDFEYFYRSGHFVHVYDVLRTTYESIVFLRYEA